MTLSDNNRKIAIQDIEEGLRFFLDNFDTEEKKRGVFLGEPFENAREEHVVTVQYDGSSSSTEVELACFGLIMPGCDGAVASHLVLFAE